ncbi:MAG: SUMF1/EgtB/PvdO family nonheme iron enzyme [Chlorobiaceae bacterium]
MSDKKVVKVLVASPSDVAAERKIADDVISTWHIRHPKSGIMLEPVLWESHGAPESGDRVQGILNKQIVDECDCAIGIFWTRVGTDTGVAPGGAVEEVQRLLNNHKPVMLYFSKANYPLNLSDSGKVMEFAGQLTRLGEYKASLQRYSLLWEYDSQDIFRQNLVTHLDIHIPEWFGSEAAVQDRIVASPELDAASAIKLYQSTLRRKLTNITLTGSPVITNFSVKLSDTFVSLRLSGTSRCENRINNEDDSCVPQQKDSTSTPEEVMSFAFLRHPLLLLIGDPGSGKTTLLKYYALSCLDKGRSSAFGFSEPVNVFYLPLRELRKGDSGYASLPVALSAWCENNYLFLPETLFSGWLEGPSTLVLLDGLDEISDVNDRIALCGWVDKMVGRFTKAKFVVTSRSTGYRKGDGIEIEASHLRTDIMDFSIEQQAEFLHRWLKAAFLDELPSSTEDPSVWRSDQEHKAAQKADAIIEFLAQEKNKSLHTLAGVPLLLQIIVMLCKERDYLPGTRAEIYDASLNYLLDHRDRRRGIFPLLSAKQARSVLSPVSLWMQAELKKEEAGKDDLQQKIQEVLDTIHNAPAAEQFCKNLVDRASLLVEHGDNNYIFRHKSFREYMAGEQLVKNIHKPGWLDNLVSHFGDDWWTEVFRFFIGHVEDAELFNSFIQTLFDSQVTDELTQKQQDLLIALIEEAPHKMIAAMGKKLLDPDTTRNRQLYILECLKTIGNRESIDTVKKFIKDHLAKTSNILQRACEISGQGELADSIIAFDIPDAIKSVIVDRFGAQYILIKGGVFTFSLTHEHVTMPDLYVAKYTVTNLNYRRFINYLNSKEEDLAREVPLERYEEHLDKMAKSINGFPQYLLAEKTLSECFRSFNDDDKRFNKENMPVIGVSWFAARAYCLWLSLLESDCCDTSLYRLPKEIEWEYVAGGKECRVYPWGSDDLPSTTRANFNDNEGSTTPVGRYPEGATPEGLYDMAGNVWEWMDDWFHTNDENMRAMRGGAWTDTFDRLRCVYRTGMRPKLFRGYHVGFRVVRSIH